MGSNFFKMRPPTQSGGSTGAAQSRAIGSAGFAGRAAGGAQTRDIGAAMAINKSPAPLKKLDRSAAYPKGPKGV